MNVTRCEKVQFTPCKMNYSTLHYFTLCFLWVFVLFCFPLFYFVVFSIQTKSYINRYSINKRNLIYTLIEKLYNVVNNNEINKTNFISLNEWMGFLCENTHTYRLFKQTYIENIYKIYRNRKIHIHRIFWQIKSRKIIKNRYSNIETLKIRQMNEFFVLLSFVEMRRRRVLTPCKRADPNLSRRSTSLHIPGENYQPFRCQCRSGLDSIM